MIGKKVIKYFAPNFDNWKPLSADGTEVDTTDSVAKNRAALNEVLLSSMQMQNLVVLSGCGTSLGDGGGPSMWNLWELCTKVDNKYTVAAKAVFKATNYKYEDCENIEVLLSLCEAHLQINNDSESSVKKFIEFCKDKILSACNFDKSDDFLSGHKTFIHRLSRRRTRDSRLKLFTTNYDTCFEEAAGKQGIVVIDGFSFSRPRLYDPRFFDFDIVRRTSDLGEVQSYLEGVFQLFKLHGSVNWERDMPLGSIQEKEASPQGACMIFPAKGKYQQSYIQPHLELMARYLSALREPNTCLFITGFGFNDDHLAEPILSAIRTNPYLKVIISDPKAEEYLKATKGTVSRYWDEMKVLSEKGQDIWFINGTFQEFSDLIPDLKSLTPAEKLAKNIQNLSGTK